MSCFKNEKNNIINRGKGCLIGGAVGDAFGYTIEFMSRDEIEEKYGEEGLREYVLSDGLAPITDDTQMTLFTAEGILLWERSRKENKGVKLENCCYKAYRDWFYTQENDCENKEKHKSVTDIYSIPELHVRRAPGFTCIRALRRKNPGKIGNPINDSKGNGGIMRVSPVAMHFSPEEYSLEEIMMLGAKTAAVTHGHPLGFISTAMLTGMLSLMIYREYPLLDAVLKAEDYTYKLFGCYEDINEMMALIKKAKELSRLEINDVEAISKLGRSALAESTLAIAIYCSLKYENNFEEAIIAAANFNGDSDTVAAVTGNIMGAHLGFDKIPEKYIHPLQFKDLILEISEKLCEY